MGYVGVQELEHCVKPTVELKVSSVILLHYSIHSIHYFRMVSFKCIIGELCGRGIIQIYAQTLVSSNMMYL